MFRAFAAHTTIFILHLESKRKVICQSYFWKYVNPFMADPL